MTRRYIHYEAAFEDLLRATGTPYIAVDETRRAIFAGSKIGSFDFVVYGTNGNRYFVDVKGRKFPYDTRGGRRYWESWVPREDLDDMACWEEAFQSGFVGLFVFAYWLLETDPKWSLPEEAVHPFRGEHYAFLGVTLADYRDNCRRRSEKWDTVSIASATFRDLAVPVLTLIADR